jgi:diguanylate cyclase (GGDEF)-like protein
METSTILFPGDLQEQLNSCKTLPNVPAVVMNVVDMCGDDKVSLGRIARVLGRDPALAATVLKVANSAYYWVASEVKTLDRAVCTLGINATLSLVLSYSFIRIMKRHDKHGFDHSYYWQRSVITAVAAKAMERWSRSTHREELFLSGLLQDIGMLVLSEAIPERYGPLVSASNRDHRRLIAIENDSLGIDHSIVGAWMLERWKLPEDLKMSLTFSHEPESIPKTELQEYARVVALAGRIAEIWTNPATVDATAYARESSVALLKMPPDSFDGVIGDTAASIPEATSYLRIEIAGKNEIENLLDRAREALIYLNLQAQQQMQQMQNLVLHDGLTAVHNRGYLGNILPQYFSAAAEMKKPLSVIFIDLDNFKNINDVYGHQAGDFVLLSVAKILKSTLRASDIVARYGGDEFVCVLPNADENAANMVSKRLRDAIASKPLVTEKGLEITITASLGHATFSKDYPYQDSKELMEAADRCLYAAKQSGRNQVYAAL